MRRQLLKMGLLAGLILPTGVTLQEVPKGVSLKTAIHHAGAGTRFEKTEVSDFRGSPRLRWKRSYMLGFGGEGFGAFEWIHQEIVAVPSRSRRGGYRLYKFSATSFDPVLQGSDRVAWDAFLKGRK